MSILADWQIIERCEKEGMITPFVNESVKTMETDKGLQKILSYGVSSYGYDIRLTKKELKLFTNLNGVLADPRNLHADVYTEPKLCVDEDGLEYVVIPPGSMLLGHTPEYFKVPRDILVTCLGKSTYARVGIFPLVTPLEPTWEGQLVVEIVNSTAAHAKVYIDQGIAQLIFNRTDAECKVSYKDRGGKYDKQIGTQNPIV
ncbi:putative deoxycytidine triphosphate deaminase [Ralstonia phage RP31]|uniref:Putative deoxycytidine triphosphate deaminase n=2 Tax=Ripduovirus RP12 TaxID=2560700 RepID=A0A1L7N0W0_9CAUD|nr:dCTP deaminase [Ralstonia phage RP12]BAW19108.1 putative deoxycytidine triphosphate deaminase [Ralstonia phage RP12]BAW19394.1 putative deoxycytidine triphosphate deaminase [Ralstonia phage RP31]